VLRPGFEPGSGARKVAISAVFSVVWDEEAKETLIKFMKSQGRSESYVARCVRYLDRFMTAPVRGPRDVLELFGRCKGGRHHLDRAFRNLLKVYRLYFGLPRGVYEELKEAIPRTRVGVDRYVPPEELVVETFRRLRGEKPKYRAFYRLVLESAARPEHVLEVLRTWDEAKLRRVEAGFYVYQAGIERATKACFRLHMTPETLGLIRETVASGDLPTYVAVQRVFQRRGLLWPRYVRKFAMNMMRRLGLSRDVVQLLAGERPRGVDAEHYIDVEKLAEQQYPLYLDYLRRLYAKI